jgi:hypothetical protein
MDLLRNPKRLLAVVRIYCVSALKYLQLSGGQPFQQRIDDDESS